MSPGDGSRSSLFWSPALLVAVADVVTKEFARRLLLPEHLPRDVVGDVVRLTLVHNPGAAFGLSVRPHSRWIFTALKDGGDSGGHDTNHTR